MKRARILLSILILLLLAACEKAAPAETPVPAVTAVPTEAPAPTEIPSLVPGAAETEELRLTVAEADGYGCVFTLENLGTRPYIPQPMSGDEGPYALLRLGAAGDWERLVPIHRSLDGYSRGLNKGETWTGAWDWSYTYGTLSAGDYALLLRGTLGRGVAKEAVYLLGTFTLMGAEPAAPGPLTLCPMPDALENSLDKRSGHRWVQTLSPSARRWMAETDYTLFRMDGDGALEYIPPAYRLPDALNDANRLLYGGSAAFDVDLAAQYGELPAGTYVLRRRFLLCRSEELDSGMDQTRNWRLIPEDRIIYGDTVFILSAALREVPRGVDPIDERIPPYTGEGSTQLISTAGSVITAEGATLRLESLTPIRGYTLGVESDYFYLYFQYQGEWYPAEQQCRSTHGLMAVYLAPGETREVSYDFASRYGALEPGVYRLVLSCFSAPFGENAGFVVCQFQINEDGSGAWAGLEEAENLVQLYSRQRQALYDLPLEGDWFYVPGPTWSRDPYVEGWELRRQGDRLQVTVYRDRDDRQAQALLGNNPQAEIIRALTPFTTPSPVRKSNTGSGLLTARRIEQKYPLDPEGTWLLSLTWQGEEAIELDPDAFLGVYVEEYDGFEDQWRRLPMTVDLSGRFDVGRDDTVTLVPGQTVNVYLVNLGWYKAQLSWDSRYRFVLAADTRAGSGEERRYFTCPFRLGQREKAAAEEEIAALRETYPMMAGRAYGPLDETFVGIASLSWYVSHLLPPEEPERLRTDHRFYALVEIVGPDETRDRDGDSERRETVYVKARVEDIVLGDLEAIPERFLDENGCVTLCYDSEFEENSMPELREGARFLLFLRSWPEENESFPAYRNCFVCGLGEVYYVTEGNILLSTLPFRRDYDGCSLETFAGLLRELYAETAGN